MTCNLGLMDTCQRYPIVGCEDCPNRKVEKIKIQCAFGCSLVLDADKINNSHKFVNTPQMIKSNLIYLRNDLQENLPIGLIDTFQLLLTVNKHLEHLDTLIAAIPDEKISSEDIFLGFKESDDIDKILDDMNGMLVKCSECPSINTVGKVVTCRIYGREIPDVDQKPDFCHMDYRL